MFSERREAGKSIKRMPVICRWRQYGDERNLIFVHSSVLFLDTARGLLYNQKKNAGAKFQLPAVPRRAAERIFGCSYILPKPTKTKIYMSWGMSERTLIRSPRHILSAAGFRASAAEHCRYCRTQLLRRIKYPARLCCFMV